MLPHHSKGPNNKRVTASITLLTSNRSELYHIISGISRVGQAGLMPRAPSRPGAQNCLTKLKFVTCFGHLTFTSQLVP